MASSTFCFSSEMVAVVTGASSGIGEGTAIKLAQMGLGRLCITGRNTHALESTKQKCIKAAPSERGIKESDVLIVSGDIGDEKTCEAIYNETISKFGRIDILVNNAGSFSLGPLDTASIDSFDDVMRINARSVVFLTQLCIPELKKTKGSIVNVSSIAGVRSFVGAGYFCMAKAAQDMYTKCLALEMAPHGVRVNAVNPGTIDTPVFKRSGLTDEQVAGLFESEKVLNPIKRVGTVEDVADLIAFLASSRASFITGNITSVDGGRNLVCPR